MSPDHPARKLADPVAIADLARVEAHERKRDPAVRLRFEDYEVTVRELVRAGDREVHVVDYVHTNPDVDFELWTGHGMHFSVEVGKSDEKTRIIHGE